MVDHITVVGVCRGLREDGHMASQMPQDGTQGGGATLTVFKTLRLVGISQVPRELH